MAEIIQGAEPIFLPGGEKGVLLLHGFTGGPSEMRLLGTFLQSQGYTVLVPRLCGHGTSPEDMEATTQVQWYHSVCDAYFILKGFCKEISVVGLSMGGLLAIQLGLAYDLAHVVSLSAPIELMDKKISLLPPLEMVRGRYVAKKRRTFADIPKDCNIAYTQTPLVSVHHLVALIKDTAYRIVELEKPFLVIHSKNDHTAAPPSAEFLFERCPSACKELMWLEESGHLVTLDCERETVFKKIADFLAVECR